MRCSLGLFWCTILGILSSAYSTHHLSAHFTRTKHAHSTMERSTGSHGHVEKHCGDWMGDYAQLHRDIRSGAKPPRYLVITPDGGLADSLACVGTAFYFALLTNRAFVFDETEEASRFSIMYRSPYIDWRSSLDELKHMSNFTFDRFVANFGKPNETEIWPMSVFRYGDLDIFGGDADVIHLNGCNAGLVLRLFDNPVYKQQLFGMGLRPETAYGCMYAFLFEILPGAREMLARETAAMEDPNSVKIGIQIRTGDATMINQVVDEPSLEEAEAAVSPHAVTFKCAETIEAQIMTASTVPRKVIWFLLTDSVRLRKSASIKYGSKVLTNLDGIKNLKHFRKEDGGGGAAAMMYSAAEHWLYSLADYHIFSTSLGGFGKSSALASLKWGFYNVLVSGCKPVNVYELASIAPYVK